MSFYTNVFAYVILTRMSIDFESSFNWFIFSKCESFLEKKNCFRSQDVNPDSMEIVVRISAALTVEFGRDATWKQGNVIVDVKKDG